MSTTKMRLTTDPVTGAVTIRYENYLGCPVERTFTTMRPTGASYVIEIDARSSYPQVCEKLSSRGPTLMAQRATLADTIRREYRAMRRVEASLNR